MAERRAWARDELLTVSALYFAIPFGQMHSRNPQVQKVAAILNRTPSSIAMKLVNFASLDPEHQRRGVRGLVGTSRLDREVWAEFQSTWRHKPSVASDVAPPMLQKLEPVFAEDVETTVKRVVDARQGQWYFRRVVLAAYGSKCCVTGNPIPELLVASHILPWAQHSELRMEPTNGLCLSATMDRAFDRGLIAFDDRLRLIISPALLRYLPSPDLEQVFLARAGSEIRMPERFAPRTDFLQRHRETVFQKY